MRPGLSPLSAWMTAHNFKFPGPYPYTMQTLGARFTQHLGLDNSALDLSRTKHITAVPEVGTRNIAIILRLRTRIHS